MGKAFKHKTCVYCGSSNSSTTGDHVVARQFFRPNERQNLPKVPSCADCNNKKSFLEHYLTSVLPFGGRLISSSDTLQTLVAPRLRKNSRLRRTLNAGQTRVLEVDLGVFRPTTAIPFESGQLMEYLKYVTKGLMAHHWSVQLPPSYSVGVMALDTEAQQKLWRLNSSDGKGRVRGNFGNGTFEYEGLQTNDEPAASLWWFSFYGGAVLTGDPKAPGSVVDRIWSFTTSKPLPASLE